MAINSYFYNAISDGQGGYDRTYNAEDVTSYLDQIVGNGVFPNPSSQLQVRVGEGMEVVVAAGQGWIHGHKLINTADLTLSIDASDVLLGRIDRIIFYTDSTERTMGIEVLKGTPAATPVAPSLTRTDSRYEMCLATVFVDKQITAITGSMITDTRADSSVCGWVQGLIQQVDTSSLFVQWNTAYGEFMDQMRTWMTAQQAAYQAWFSTLTEDLQVGAYVEKYSKIVDGGENVSNVIPLDMTGYSYETGDIFLVNLNGLMLVNGYDYSIDDTTSPATIEINAQLVENNRVEIVVLKSVLGTPIELDGDDTLYGPSGPVEESNT